MGRGGRRGRSGGKSEGDGRDGRHLKELEVYVGREAVAVMRCGSTRTTAILVLLDDTVGPDLLCSM